MHFLPSALCPTWINPPLTALSVVFTIHGLLPTIWYVQVLVPCTAYTYSIENVSGNMLDEAWETLVSIKFCS